MTKGKRDQVMLPGLVSLSWYQDRPGTHANVPSSQPCEGSQIKPERTPWEILLPCYPTKYYCSVDHSRQCHMKIHVKLCIPVD